NGVLSPRYFGVQAGLITMGVVIFVVAGLRLPDLSANRGIFLAFTIGVLTIIPAVLMGLGRIPGIWPQYFYIAFGMATGSFLSFLFIKFTGKLVAAEEKNREQEINHGD
ncbi:MAG: hypothetical protein R3264_18680, partial [Anaerolineae bacterium]|nr:hypothetical protein [Anaerolineae bacterium]